jgi:hypothetical protein
VTIVELGVAPDLDFESLGLESLECIFKPASIELFCKPVSKRIGTFIVLKQSSVPTPM